MKSKILWTAGMAAMLAFCGPQVRAQEGPVPKTIAASVGDALQYAQGEFLSVAEAMPAEKYSFIPSMKGGNFEGVRSFAEQVKHVACANFAFFDEIEGKTPPKHCEKGGSSKARTKAELIAYLKESIADGNRVVATINQKNALERVDGPYAAPNTKLGLAVTAVWHVTDHYGQIVEYLRMNGIVPPGTQRTPLKVR